MTRDSAARRSVINLHDVPLGFLPAFVAAGRLGSFAAAAAELHLTPSAISQQIRALEDALGVDLFVRNGRTATLTREGQDYLQEVGRALEQLSAASARVRGQTHSHVLRLSTFALLAHEFLLPRLSQFRASFPQLSLRVESSNRYVDLCSSECAAAIRHGNGWPELTAYPLGRVSAAVICSPKLASSIRTPSDLLQHTLLDVDGDGARGYAMLMQAHGLPMQPSKVWHFETCHETLTAAEHGLGFGFALFPIATHWISSGRLVALAEPVQLPGELALVHRPGDASRFPFAELAAWLRAQYAALPALERRPATPQAVHSAEQPAARDSRAPGTYPR